MKSSGPRLFLVDVFTQEVFRGNPVAIVIADSPPASGTMLNVARWTGMPETVFVLPRAAHDHPHPSADYEVRIWSPVCELPFAGHPSIGAAHVLLEEGLIAPRHGRFVQQCPAGRIDMRTTSGEVARRIAFRTPVPDVQPLQPDDHATVCTALRYEGAETRSAVVEAGARWIVVQLPSDADVDALSPDMNRINELSELFRVSGITVLGRVEKGAADFEVRSFAPAIGVPEDAVCGGGNACAAAWIAYQSDWEAGCANKLISQGRHVGRAGRVFWEGPDQNRRLEIGGYAVTVAAGTMRLS